MLLRRFSYHLPACFGGSRTELRPLSYSDGMLFDLQVRACSRTCFKTEKTLEPGETYFSDLVEAEGQVVRRDYSVTSWEGPAEGSLGWWRSRVPAQEEKQKLAPSEVLLNLFIALEDNSSETQFRYVLSLLLVRRKLLKPEESTRDQQGQEVLVLSSAARKEQYEVIVDEPNEVQALLIQQRMIDLLYGDGEKLETPEATQAA